MWLQPCLRHQNLGASINDTAATYNKKKGKGVKHDLGCIVESERAAAAAEKRESLGKPKLSASTAPPSVGFLKHLDIWIEIEIEATSSFLKHLDITLSLIAKIEATFSQLP